MRTVTTSRTEVAYSYKGSAPRISKDSNAADRAIAAIRQYIAASVEYGNDAADFVILTRDVITSVTEWEPVGEPTFNDEVEVAIAKAKAL